MILQKQGETLLLYLCRLDVRDFLEMDKDILFNTPDHRNLA